MIESLPQAAKSVELVFFDTNVTKVISYDARSDIFTKEQSLLWLLYSTTVSKDVLHY